MPAKKVLLRKELFLIPLGCPKISSVLHFIQLAAVFWLGKLQNGANVQAYQRNQNIFPLVKISLSSCNICRISTPGALILNHLQEAKTTVKSWSLTTDSKFNAICCFNAAVLHPNSCAAPCMTV